jgi:hypothetical protein
MPPDAPKPSFKTRRFVVALTALSGLTLPVTGLVVHLRHNLPPGPGRHIWMTAHAVFAVCFLVCCIWHISYNWRAVQAALLAQAADKPKLTKECLLALGVMAVLFWFLLGSRGR